MYTSKPANKSSVNFGNLFVRNLSATRKLSGRRFFRSRRYTWNRADTARLEYAYDDLSRVSRIRQTAAGSSINYGMVYSMANTDTKKLGKISGIPVPTPMMSWGISLPWE